MKHFYVQICILCFGLWVTSCGTENSGVPNPLGGAQPTQQVPATPFLQPSQLPVQPGIPQPPQVGMPSQGAAAAVKQIPGYIYIPPGTFNVGTRQGEIPRCPGREMVETQVTLGGFYIQQYPVPGVGKLPVIGVTWDQAKASCESVNARLCTEMEWERACKGPDGSQYPYGNEWNPMICSVKDKSDNMLPIGTFAGCVTEEGVHDMVGGQWEWTSSTLGIPGKKFNNTVLRGGWKQFGRIPNRCSHRYSADRSKVSQRVGYRCCFGPVNPQAISVPQNEGDLFRTIKLKDKGFANLKRALPLLNIGRKYKNIRTMKRNDAQTIWRPSPNVKILVAKLEYDKKNGQRGGSLLVFAIMKYNHALRGIAAFDRPEKNGDDVKFITRGEKETKRMEAGIIWYDKTERRAKRLVGKATYDCGLVRIKPEKWLSSEDERVPRVFPSVKTLYDLTTQNK